MTFRLEIQSEHAAFDGDAGDEEVARILRLVSDVVTHRPGTLGGGLDDPDGNTIGMWRYRRGLQQVAPPED